jgi:hypothetical protein
MAYKLCAHVVEDEDTISVTHIFWGNTPEECNRVMKQHAAGCAAFGPAFKEDRVIVEKPEEIDPDEIPSPEDFEVENEEEEEEGGEGGT